MDYDLLMGVVGLSFLGTMGLDPQKIGKYALKLYGYKLFITGTNLVYSSNN